MVLTEQDKKILLDRLKAGREKKKAEREAAAKKQKTQEAKAEAVVPVEVPVSAPTAAPETAPVVPQQHAEQLPSEPSRIDPSKARKPAKQVEPSSDSDSEIEERKNKSSKSKNKKKNVPFMKIKIYQEPKNPEALNALIGAVQEEQQAPPVELSPPEKQRVTNVIPKQKLAAPIVRQNTMRALAMDIFG
jgi:hypothetical protein